MDEPETGRTGPAAPDAECPLDGTINFTGYSDRQLSELRFTIHRERFPKNFATLQAEIDRRARAEIAPGLETELVAGRLSRHDGLRGWLESKLTRSPLYGLGSMEFMQDQLVLNGWRRTWLGTPLQGQLVVSTNRIRNVVRDGDTVRFELTNSYWPVKRIAFRPEEQLHTASIVARLPSTRAQGFERRWESVRDFNARLRNVSQRPVVTPTLVAANMLIFAVMCVAGKDLGRFTLAELVTWGDNAGPLTVNGQWWRLVTALFLHVSLPHLLLNMWVLWNIGRLCEQVFGRWTFALLYFATGVLGGLTSIAWNPDVNSAGASGAIFGALGAFLAFFLNPGNRVPATIARRHWIGTSLFVVFNLVSGAMQTGIDNAAHVGGLVEGFALGWILARPLEMRPRTALSVQRGALAVSVLALSMTAALWQVKGTGSELTVPEQFYHSHTAFMRAQENNMKRWNELAARSAGGNISDTELSERFARDIVPFWQAAQAQLEKESQSAQGAVRAYTLVVADFVRARRELAEKVLEAANDPSVNHLPEITALASKVGAAQARAERIQIRSSMDHRPRALANNPAVAALRRLVIGYHWTCVHAPVAYGPIPIASDDPRDGPAARQALGCLAQQLFMSGDYRKLDSMMHRYSLALGDLPDGSSSHEGLLGGLNDLFNFGGIDPLQLLGRTSDWRRIVKGSKNPDLLEAAIFEASAWSVRGTGFATSVSAQQWALFAYRIEMASAALADTAEIASSEPAWYTLSLNIGLDQDKDVEKLRTTFDEGHERFPAYHPLERRMMRILMPRWHGSYAMENEFIDAVYKTTAAERGFERYAELYSEYVELEGDDLDLFADTAAFWSGMRSGYLGLVKRYPESDFVINRLANMACRAGDADEYQKLHDAIARRYASVAWSTKYSRDACDKKFALLNNSRAAHAPHIEPILKPLESFGGIRLGISTAELEHVRGRPLGKPFEDWSYPVASESSEGMLRAVFSSGQDAAEAKLIRVEFTGNEASAPPELPYLNGSSENDLKDRFGYLVGMGSPSEGVTRFQFKNGVYADARDGKVFRYGIYAIGRVR